MQDNLGLKKTMNKCNEEQESEVVENISVWESSSPREFQDDVTRDNF